MAVAAVGARTIAIPFCITKIDCTGFTAGAPETISHLGPSGVTADKVELVLTTGPTDGSTCQLIWLSSSTTNNTVTFKVNCTGSMDGAVGYVVCTFYAQASAGLNPPT